MKTLAMLLIFPLITGCAAQVVKIVEKEPYPVYLSIPNSPPPPDITPCDLLVDKLSDNADAGTVVQAYKHDMACLRGKMALYRSALDQYKATSEAAAVVEEAIKKRFDGVLEKYKADIEAARRAGDVIDQAVTR